MKLISDLRILVKIRIRKPVDQDMRKRWRQYLTCAGINTLYHVDQKVASRVHLKSNRMMNWLTFQVARFILFCLTGAIIMPTKPLKRLEARK